MKRNYGIDFLRILSMFMVAMLHVLGHGGILSHAEPLSVKYWVAWTLEFASYSAVNCFALISGYVMSQSKFRVSKVINLWLQTTFYTVSIAIIFLIFMPGTVGKKTIVEALLPITSQRYWYISAYFGVMILTPFLNIIVEHVNQKTFKNILLSMFVLFSIMPLIFLTDPYTLYSGYSTAWLAILYLAGGYIKKYDVVNKIKASYAWITVFLMIMLSVFAKFVIETFLQNTFFSDYNNMFMYYTAPTIVLISVGLLIGCCKLNFKPLSIKIIKFLSPAVLGVYLTHVNPLIWDHIITNFSVRFLKYNCITMVGLIFLSALIIFTAGIFSEKIRVLLFKFCKVDKFVAFIEQHIGENNVETKDRCVDKK